MMKDRDKAAIKIIESPEYDSMDQEELSEILGGWNCDTYTKYPYFRFQCHEWISGPCRDSRKRNYCNKYSIVKKK